MEDRRSYFDRFTDYRYDEELDNLLLQQDDSNPNGGVGSIDNLSKARTKKNKWQDEYHFL
ncbi:hypothetical protein [Halonatronum saccharophilum]|uniref:hypothetical protein n=1 Tax=Halonatronum saccharophilum TaxID=150060 RepID=UPI00048364C5|nr:hypothetical protein [Halonatronum saccharophilum]